MRFRQSFRSTRASRVARLARVARVVVVVVVARASCASSTAHLSNASYASSSSSSASARDANRIARPLFVAHHRAARARACAVDDFVAAGDGDSLKSDAAPRRDDDARDSERDAARVRTLAARSRRK
jgi:hypothetical protein